jgi:hypothetical protein
VKATQYGAVGFTMGCIGSAIVHGMTALRERLDTAFEPPPTEQPIAGTGVGWLYFMGLNSNIRYNALNAAEDILYARCAPEVALIVLTVLIVLLALHSGIVP